MKQKKVIIINAETTGLDAKSDELLRISIISDSGTILFNEYVHPTKHTEWPAAQKIHHITPEMVANCQPLLYYLKDLKEIISDADIIVGYNHSFDMSFLAEAGVDSDPRKNYDLMLEFSQLIGEWDDTRNTYKFFSLRECADYLGYQWPTGKDHDCLEDCKAILYCYKKFAAGETGKGGLPNRSQLRASSSAPTVRIPVSAIIGAFISVATIIIIAIYLASSVAEEKMARKFESNLESNLNDKHYGTYLYLKSTGEIDENGDYNHITDVTEEGAPFSAPIHVTFAKNAYMDIQYYHDKERKEEIDIKNCHMSAGDIIYIGEVHYHNLKSSTYQLSTFEIKEFDDAGHMVNVIKQPAESMLSLDVSDSCQEISIVPIGIFKNRMLNLHAFYYDLNGMENDLSGVWTTNDTPYDDKLGINPLIDYQVKCDYETYSQTYYFVNAWPKYQFHEGQNEVIFSSIKSTDENLDYQVELHPYISLTIANPEYKKMLSKKAISSIEIERAGERKEIEFKDGASISADQLTKLKHNDIVHITLDSSFQIIDPNKNLSISNPTIGAATRTVEYSITIPKDNYRNLKVVVTAKNSTSTGPVFIPAIDNTTISLISENGKYPISDNDQKPNENEKVTITIRPAEGYYLEGKGIKNDRLFTKTMKFKDYEKAINNILSEIDVKKHIKLLLKPEDQYGSATYKLEKEEVSGSVTAKEGQKIIIDFKVAPNSDVYIVNEKGKLKASAKTELIVTAEMDHMIIYPSTNFDVKAVSNNG